MWPDYQRSARLLDARYSPAGTTPIHDRLTSYTPTRGLVFGAYGGASADVHDLVSLAASRVAERQWRLAGARSASEYRSFVVTRMRRRLGMAAAQATGWHACRTSAYRVRWSSLAHRVSRVRVAATSSTTLAPSTPTRREGRCSVAERAGGARRVCGEVRR